MSGFDPLDGPTVTLLGGALGVAALALARGRSGRVGAVFAAAAVALGVTAIGRAIGAPELPAAIPGDLLPAGERPLASLVAGLGVVALAVAGLGALSARRPGALAGWFALAHGGVALLTLVLGGERAVAAACVSIVAMSLAVPGVVLVAPGPRAPRGGRPLPRVLLALFLISLAGLPPLLGFPARFLALGTLISSGFPVLAILVTALSALPLIAAVRMLLELRRTPDDAITPPPGRVAVLVAAALAVTLLALGILFEPLLDIVRSIWTVRGLAR